MKPALPFQSEPLESLRLRMPAAVQKIWDADEILRQRRAGEDGDRPYLHRAHVFDLAENGNQFRIIVSVDHSVRFGESRLHLSISRGPAPFDFNPDDLTTAASIAARLLRPPGAGNRAELGLTIGGVVHVVLPWPLQVEMTQEARQCAAKLDRFPDPPPALLAERLRQLRQMGFHDGMEINGHASGLEQYARVICHRDSAEHPGLEPVFTFITRHPELLARAADLETIFGVKPVDAASDLGRALINRGKGLLPASFDAATGGAP